MLLSGAVRHRIDGLETSPLIDSQTQQVRHRIDGLENTATLAR